MRISIIIPSIEKNLPYLKACVDSIKKYSTEEHEIIVVTNPDPYYDLPIDGITRIHSSSQGQCAAVNIGVKAANTEYILISDDDVIFPPHWERLIEKAQEVDFLSGHFVESGKKGGVAAPFTTRDFGNDPDTFNREGWEWESEGEMWNEDKFEKGFGFPLVLKKELWERIGGYDESYDPWGSNCDSDLEYKLMLAGVTPMRWRGAGTYHFGQVSGTFNPENSAYWQRNTSYFERKWGLARARAPQIWYCDFVIDGDAVTYRPEWAKWENNPNVYCKKIKLQHVGWVTNNIDLFERFWMTCMGFKRIWDSEGGTEMYKVLFDIDVYAHIRRYEKDGVIIEVHWFDPPAPEDKLAFYKRGLNHVCIWVDDRERFLKLYSLDKKVYDNPKGHQNIFIRDFEGNWIEIYATI